MFCEGEFGPELVVLDEGRLLVQERWVELFARAGLKSFRDFMNTDQGEVLAERTGRVRMRLQLEGAGGSEVFYLKRHDRPKWLKRLSRTLGLISGDSTGRRELSNIFGLKALGLTRLTVAAAGETGPTDGSFIMTEELDRHKPLNAFLKEFLSRTDQAGFLKKKRELIRAVGSCVRRLHEAGMDHRDLYLCHLFVRPDDPAESLSLIDLQRISRHRRVRWWGRIKDLAALNYSAGQVGVSRADRLRFVLEYFQTRHLNRGQRRLLWLVEFKTGRISRHDRRLQANCGGQDGL